MFKFLTAFLILAVCLFLGVNYFLIPYLGSHLPSEYARYMSPLNPYGAAGLSGLCCGMMLLFGKKFH